MINPRNPFNDIETKRQLRNNTSTQRKNMIDTKQGVIINTIPREESSGMADLRSDYVIPEHAELPKDLFVPTSSKDDKKKENSKNPLLYLAGATLLLTGGVAGVAKLGSKIARSKLKIPQLKTLDDLKDLTENAALRRSFKNFVNNNNEKLPDIGRNMNLNKEEFFVSYMLIRNPEIKTVMATAAFAAFSITGFVLKNFVDGAKSIWVKKKELDAEKNLQENLIDVETRVFKGKNEIIRNMLSTTALELQRIESNKKYDRSKKTFSGFLRGTPTFGHGEDAKKETQTIQEKTKAEEKKQNKLYPFIGLGTVAASVLFAASAYKNIKKVDKLLGKTHDELLKSVQGLLDNAPEGELSKYKDNVVDIVTSFNFKADYADKMLKKVGCDDDVRNNVVSRLRQSNNKFAMTPYELGGLAGNWQFYSYNDDARGHFYNWMMNLGSKPLGILSVVLTAVSGIGYVGKQGIEAIRDAEVKKANTDSELELQKSLINTELKNFYSKKMSYIEPLMAEIRKKYPDISDEELRKMADNVLSEIKNGPPFVYA